jgi:amidohydrolase
MAMLLGAAKVLSENKDALNCTVKFIFQPAEEDLTGAFMMLESPELDDVDTYMAIHNMNKIPVGKVSAQAGPRMAANGTFTIKVIGSGGHGAYPEMSVDPIVAACALVGNLQTICSREKSPLTTAVVSVCSFNAGNRCNIIPAYAELTGTVRGYDQNFLDSLPEIMERIVKHTCEAYRTTYEFHLEPMALMVVNDPSCTLTAQKAVTKILGEDALYDAPQSTGSEDFSFFIKDKPGVLAFVGSGKPNEEMYPLHNSKADIDEDCLINGAALYAQYVIETQASNNSPNK